MIPSLHEGEQVAGYVIEARIGVGGFGEVYRARHPVIEREVAIKVLHRRYSNDPESVARFVAEARSVNKISHRNIVEVYDFGKLGDGRQFCVMELIEGTTLRDLLRARRRLPLADALPILRGIAEAVDAAHAVGIAHRDLKPDNVFVRNDDTIKLIDFGLAKLTRELDAPITQTGSALGTPMYMSPEQCRGKAIDTRTDLYSFGVLAYHVLVGEPPFSGDALELALHHLNDEPVPPSRRCAELSRNVDRVVLALLAKEPADRPASLVNAIDALAGATTLRARRWKRRARRAVIVAAPLALGAVLSVWWMRPSAVRSAPKNCASADDRLAGVWDSAIRESLGEHFAGAHRIDVTATWTSISQDLDIYSTRWSRLWNASCAAPDQRSDPLLYVQRQTCLDSALVRMRGVVKLLASADPVTTAHAFGVDAIPSAVTDLDDCTNLAILREQRSPPPPELRAEAARLTEEFLTAWMQWIAAAATRQSPDDALARMQQVADRLEAMGLSSAAEAGITADALTLLATLEPAYGERARAAIADTIRRAEASHSDAVLAHMYDARAELELASGGDTAMIEDTLARGEAAATRAGQPWRLAAARAELDIREGQLDHAVKLLRSEVERSTRWVSRGPPDAPWPRARQAHMRLIDVLGRLGRHDEAIAEARRLVSANREALGEYHLSGYFAHLWLDHALARAGRTADALAETDTEMKILHRIEVDAPIHAVALRRMLYAQQLGRVDVVAAARATAIQAGETDRSIVEIALAMGALELARAEVDELKTLPTAGIEDVRAGLDFATGDLDGMKRHADLVVPTMPATEPALNTWILGLENAPWYEAIADAAAGRRHAAEERLAALAPMHAPSVHMEVRGFALVKDGWVLAALGRWRDARASFESAHALPILGRDHTGSVDPDSYLAMVDAWLGVARLEAGDAKAALGPLEESLDQLIVCCDGFQWFAPMAELALARALWETGGDKARARYLAEQARDHFARLGTFKEADRLRAVQWLEDHPAR